VRDCVGVIKDELFTAKQPRMACMMLCFRGHEPANAGLLQPDEIDETPLPVSQADAVCTINYVHRERGASQAEEEGISKKLAGLRLRASLQYVTQRCSATSPAPPRHPSATLHDLPSAAVSLIWQHMAAADRRAARLACRCFDAAVQRLTLRPCDVRAAGDLGRSFPALGSIVLQLGPHHASDLEVVHLHAWARSNAGRLMHLHTLEVYGRLRGAALTAVASFAAATPSLKHLRLSGLRLSGGGKRGGTGGGREEQLLRGMLDALPGLRELDLGCGSSSRASDASSGTSASPPLPLAVLRSIAQLRQLESLTCDMACVRDGGCAAAALRNLPYLRSLVLGVSAPPRTSSSSSSSSSSGCCGGADDDAGRLDQAAGGGAALARALCGLTRLEHLELESRDLGEDFAAALGRLSQLQRLRTLALGLCPTLPSSVAGKVRSSFVCGWLRLCDLIAAVPNP